MHKTQQSTVAIYKSGKDKKFVFEGTPFTRQIVVPTWITRATSSQHNEDDSARLAGALLRCIPSVKRVAFESERRFTVTLDSPARWKAEETCSLHEGIRNVCEHVAMILAEEIRYPERHTYGMSDFAATPIQKNNLLNV